MIPNRLDRGIPPVLVAASVAFLLLVFVAGCGGNEASEPPAGERGGQEEAGQATAPEGTDTADGSMASIGEPITIGDVRWTVTDAQRYDKLVSNFGTDEEGYYIVVDITFQNNSNQDITLATPFMTIFDNQGRKFEPDIDINFRQVKPEDNMFIDQVKPGTTKEGQVIFPVPSDASGLRLRVGEARFALDKTAYIDLGI